MGRKSRRNREQRRVTLILGIPLREDQVFDVNGSLDGQRILRPKPAFVSMLVSLTTSSEEGWVFTEDEYVDSGPGFESPIKILGLEVFSATEDSFPTPFGLAVSSQALDDARLRVQKAMDVLGIKEEIRLYPVLCFDS